MRILRLIEMVAFLFLMILTENARADFSPDDRAGLVNRLAKLQNIIVECDVHDRMLPPPSSTPQTPLTESAGVRGSLKMVLMLGEFDNQERFYFFSGRARYEKELLRCPVEMQQFNMSKSIMVFTPERFEKLTYGTKARPHLAGSIWNETNDQVPNSIVDMMLGIRKPFLKEWMTAADFDKVKFSYPTDDLLVGRKDFPDKTGFELLTYSRRLGYPLVEYQQFTLPDLTYPHYTLKLDKFHALESGIEFPFHATTTTSHPEGGKQVVSMASDIEVTDVRVDDPSNTASLYAIESPTGIIVTDTRTNFRIKISGHPRALSDAQIADEMAKQLAAKAAAIAEAKKRISQATSQSAR